MPPSTRPPPIPTCGRPCIRVVHTATQDSTNSGTGKQGLSAESQQTKDKSRFLSPDSAKLPARTRLVDQIRGRTQTPSKACSSNPSTTLSDASSKRVDNDKNSSASINYSRKQLPRKEAENKLPLTIGPKRDDDSRTNPAQRIRVQHIENPSAPDQSSGIGTPRYMRELERSYSRYPTPRPAPTRNSSFEVPSAEDKSKLDRDALEDPFNDPQEPPDSNNPQDRCYSENRIEASGPYLYFGEEKGVILYLDELEDDDRCHAPSNDDDKTSRASWKYYGNRRMIINIVGGVCLVLGLVAVFIVVPILTFSTDITRLKAWAHVNNNTYPLLDHVRRGLIDPTTPASVRTRTSTFDGPNLELVFSDEFNVPNRTFYPGDDPFWTAANVWYGSTQDLEWYDPDAVTTGGGTLQLKLDRFPSHNLQFRSGMLNSWNQLCFKGGVFEVSVSLAGPAGVPGLWPGVWTLGNLGRPGYRATTDGLWPYSYDSCDHGITPNQSSPDGLSYLPGQRLSSCTCEGADHPNPGSGRGAPEIDVLEAAVDPNNRIGVVTQSYQVAPFDVFWRPNAEFTQIPNYETTMLNTYCGGPYQQAISATTLLNNSWYNGTAYQKYAFEYVPGMSSDGKIAWFVGEQQTYMMDGRAIGPNGNVASRMVSEEPMSMVLNLGISDSWSEVLFGDLKFPTVMHIDYVRIYQKPGATSITCDLPGYPTTEYIREHAAAYNNPNFTQWIEAGYTWPKNTFTGC